jgi:signal transduction histidine kinase
MPSANRRLSRGSRRQRLGLTVVSQIASTHGCEVSVEEREIGGSRFEFTGVGE